MEKQNWDNTKIVHYLCNFSHFKKQSLQQLKIYFLIRFCFIFCLSQTLVFLSSSKELQCYPCPLEESFPYCSAIMTKLQHLLCCCTAVWNNQKHTETHRHSLSLNAGCRERLLLRKLGQLLPVKDCVWQSDPERVLNSFPRIHGTPLFTAHSGCRWISDCCFLAWTWQKEIEEAKREEDGSKVTEETWQREARG